MEKERQSTFLIMGTVDSSKQSVNCYHRHRQPYHVQGKPRHSDHHHRQLHHRHHHNQTHDTDYLCEIKLTRSSKLYNLSYPKNLKRLVIIVIVALLINLSRCSASPSMSPSSSSFSSSSSSSASLLPSATSTSSDPSSPILSSISTSPSSSSSSSSSNPSLPSASSTASSSPSLSSPSSSQALHNSSIESKFYPSYDDNYTNNNNQIKSEKEGETNEKLKQALKEDNIDNAMRKFLEAWETHHNRSGSLDLPSTSLSGHSKGKSRKYREIRLDKFKLAGELSDDDFGSRKGQMFRSSSSSPSSPSIDLPRNCSSCAALDVVKQRRIRSIKAHILHALRLKKEPNVTRQANLDLPPFRSFLDASSLSLTMDSDERKLYTLYSKDEPMSADQAYPSSGDEDNLDDFSVDTTKAISFASKPPENWNFLAGIKTQYFKFSSNVVNAPLSKAHLWVYISPNRLETSKDNAINATVVAYEIRKYREPVSLLHVRSRKFTLNRKGRWITLDIRKMVIERFRQPNSNFGLVIHAYDDKGRSLHVTSPYDGENHPQKTFIELNTKKENSNRVRRDTGLRCEEGSKEINCCLHPLTVDFEEFGWDWIIAPKRYEANFCSGECPYMYLQDTNHAHLVQQANPSMSTGPCCTPRKMSSISMLYYDDNNQIILGTLKGMKAERCGCA